MNIINKRNEVLIMCKSFQTLKTNIAKGSRRLSKTTVKNIINENCFDKIELGYYYDGMSIHKGEIIEDPVNWFNNEYDRLDVSLYKVENNLVIIHLTVHSNLWYNLYIDLGKNYKQSEQQQETETKVYIDTMQKKFKEGEGTAEELKQYYVFLRDNEESVSKVILDKLNNSPKYKNKRKNTKAELTKDIYNNMIEDLVYIVQDSLSYGLDFSDPKGSRQRAIEKIINSATNEMIQNKYNKDKLEREARTEKLKETIEVIQNPQTLDDFQKVFLYRKDKTLTSDEQEKYDYLLAIHNKDKREKEQQERAKKANAIITGLSEEYTITADVDTRDNSPLWVVKLNRRVEREEFKTIKYQVMKPIEGYWSNFKHGFIFKYDPTSKLLGEQPEQEQTQEQSEEQQNISNSDKLRKVADNMQSAIDGKRADRQTNTARRARMVASAEQDADGLEYIQGVLRNIANAIDNQELKLINQIDSRAQILTLESILHRANWKQKTVENIDYNIWHETEPTTNIIKYVEIPSSTIYLRQLQSIINDIRNTDGFKLIANRFQKLVNNTTPKDKDHDPLIDITGHEEELDRIYKNTDALKNQYFETAIEERRRLARMGIETVEELRAYLKEYWNYRDVKLTVDPTQKKIKELERQYKLDQKGDINFTPKEIALQMIEYADIDNNSKILEPSAGIGNIADQIKKFIDNVDVCEMMNNYRELLTLKGFNVVGQDFLEYNNSNYYDAIIMNPPFSDEQNHIKHAYDLLKDGGKLVAITSPHWTFANDKSSKEFKQWFNDLGGEIIEDLESGTFEMTGVRSQIIIINKDTETMQKAVNQ